MSDKLQKAVRMVCKNCGGSLELVDSSHAACKYCGQNYLLNDAMGLAAEVNISYGDKEKTGNIIKIVLILLCIFFVVAAIVVSGIWRENKKARDSELAAEEEVQNQFDLDTFMNGGYINLKVPFCEAIFGKKYKEITAEEFASIRYLKLVDNFPEADELHYSFTDYKDCASEEEFQNTVEVWETPSDVYAFYVSEFSGLTRIEGLDRIAIRSISEEAEITYVEVEDIWFHVLHERVNPEKVEVLKVLFETDMRYEYLDYLEKYVNVKEFGITGYSYYLKEFAHMDFAKLAVFPKLEKLHLAGYGQVYDNLELLAELPNLKSLTLEINFENYLNVDYLKQLTDLEELRIGSLPEEFDASFLKEMTNLTVLSLPEWTQVTEDMVSGMPKLQELKGMVTDRATMEEVSKLQNLQWLELRMDLADSEKQTDGLEFPTVDMTPFAQMPDLEYLKIFAISAENVELLLNHPKLKVLDLSYQYNPIESLPEPEIWIDSALLSDNPFVEQLSFNNCVLKDTATGEKLDLSKLLPHYPYLELLELDNCRLVNITPLAECKNLRECSLRYNQIVDFSPLQECKKLELIHVYENPYESIELSEEVIIDDKINLYY